MGIMISAVDVGAWTDLCLIGVWSGDRARGLRGERRHARANEGEVGMLSHASSWVRGGMTCARSMGVIMSRKDGSLISELVHRM